MDPLDPESFHHYTARLSTGRTYHFIDERPASASPDAPTLLCVHGFPDSWYAWRHLVRPWVTTYGLRVVAPDMLGYGRTDKPARVEEYSTRKLCADLVALLDYLGIERAVVVGHDWGSFTAGRFALWHPDRLRALALLSIPFTPPTTTYVPLDEVVRRVPAYAYQAYLADPRSTAEIEANLTLFLDAMYGRWRADPPHTAITLGDGIRRLARGELAGKRVPRAWLSDAEMAYTAAQMRGAMHGPLAYYRTTKVRFEEENEASLGARVALPASLPVLYIYGTKDATATPSAVPRMRAAIGSDLRVRALDGVGHWVMLEAHKDVVEEAGAWLKTLGVLDGKARARM